MKIFVFDTETTGLPTEKNASILASHKLAIYCSTIVFAYMILIIAMVLDYVDKIIKLPSEYKISKESENIHKITNEMSQTKGVDIKRELVEFNRYIITSEILL